MLSPGKISPLYLHCFLIPVYFIFHNYVDFLSLVDFSKLTTSVIIWLALPFLLLGIYMLIYKEFSKAALATSWLLLVFFFAGPLMKELKNLPYINVLSKYSVFIPVLFLSLILVHRTLYKKQESFKKAHLFIFIMLTVLICFDVVKYFIIKSNPLHHTSIKTTTPLLKRNTLSDTIQKPDIYFLVFDEHPSAASVKTLFDFDNIPLDSSLENMGFKISPFAHSAYSYTAMSICSNLGLTEFAKPRGNDYNFKDILKAELLIKQNVLVPFLEQNNYGFVNASIFSTDKYPSPFREEMFWTRPEDMVRKQTLFLRIHEDLGWNYTWLIKNKFIEEINQKIKIETDAAQKVVSLLDSTLTVTHNTPLFFYGHFMLPHSPNKYDSTGNINHWSYQSYTAKHSKKETYISQLKYTRNFIIETARKIITKNKKPMVLIIQGDHGYRMFNREKYSTSHKFSILSAIYFSDKDYNEIPDDLYAPNTMRIVLNKYFNTNLPLLYNTTLSRLNLSITH
jgi:hypothetical protein